MSDNRKYRRMYREWLHDLLVDRPRGTKAKLAAHLGLDGDKLSKMLSGTRDISASELLGIADFFEAEPPGFQMQRTLKIVGRAGAATDGTIVQETDQGPFGEILAPTGAQPDHVAVEVAGSSMGLYAPDGSLILYRNRHEPPQDFMLGQICVVGLPDGRVLVKRLLRGSSRGLFDLESVVGGVMADQRVEWAALVDLVVYPHHARQLHV